jgi:hypothetical protein
MQDAFGRDKKVLHLGFSEIELNVVEGTVNI